MTASKLFLYLFIFILLFLSVDQQAAAQGEFDPSDPSLNDEQLLRQVQNEGSVMVIVGLELPTRFRVEGELEGAQVEVQRAAIKQSQQRLLDQLSESDSRTYAKYETIPYMALNVDQAGLHTLLDSPFVTSIQEDVPVPTTLLDSTAVIGAPAAWNAGYEGSSQTVVILDTGIDADHAFFGGRVVTEACFSNAGGGGGGTTLCPNGEVSQTGNGAANSKIAACNGGGLCNHGTHVAGIAAGRGVDFDGVARGADIIAIQVFTRFQGEVCGGSSCILSYHSDQLMALQYIQSTLQPAYNIAAVNMSLGGGQFTDQEHCDSSNRALKEAIDNLRSMNVATVIAAGNSGYSNALAAPGCISSAIAVSSTTKSDQLSSFSNMHEMVELLVPGSGIKSSIVGGGFTNLSGTSMAAPHVTGAWAVLKAIHPTASVDDVLSVLEQTGLPITDTRTIADDPIIKPRIQLDLAAETMSHLTQPTNFEATRTDTGILLTWQTRTEINKQGFNLYRDTREELENAELLNPNLIPSQEADSTQGFFYELLDMETETDNTYYYWLEEIDPDGTISLLGPVRVGLPPTAVTLSQFSIEEPAPAGVPVGFMLMALVGMALLIMRRR